MVVLELSCQIELVARQSARNVTPEAGLACSRPTSGPGTSEVVGRRAEGGVRPSKRCRVRATDTNPGWRLLV